MLLQCLYHSTRAHVLASDKLNFFEFSSFEFFRFVSIRAVQRFSLHKTFAIEQTVVELEMPVVVFWWPRYHIIYNIIEKLLVVCSRFLNFRYFFLRIYIKIVCKCVKLRCDVVVTWNILGVVGSSTSTSVWKNWWKYCRRL